MPKNVSSGLPDEGQTPDPLPHSQGQQSSFGAVCGGIAVHELELLDDEELELEELLDEELLDELELEELLELELDELLELELRKLELELEEPPPELEEPLPELEELELEELLELELDEDDEELSAITFPFQNPNIPTHTYFPTNASPSTKNQDHMNPSLSVNSPE